MKLSTKERTFIMQRFLAIRSQATREKILRLAGLMSADQSGEDQNDTMFAAIAYYMKNPEKVKADLAEFSSTIPDITEGKPRASEVRNRRNRRKGEI